MTMSIPRDLFVTDAATGDGGPHQRRLPRRPGEPHPHDPAEPRHPDPPLHRGRLRHVLVARRRPRRHHPRPRDRAAPRRRRPLRARTSAPGRSSSTGGWRSPSSAAATTPRSSTASGSPTRPATSAASTGSRRSSARCWPTPARSRNPITLLRVASSVTDGLRIDDRMSLVDAVRFAWNMGRLEPGVASCCRPSTVPHHRRRRRARCSTSELAPAALDQFRGRPRADARRHAHRPRRHRQLRAGRRSSTACRSSPRPATASASSRPTAPARRRCCACSPACSAPDAGVGHRRATGRHGRLPRPGARSGRRRRRCGRRWPAAPASPPPPRARRRHRRARGGSSRAPTTATPRRSTGGWRSAAPTSTPGSARCGPTLDLPARLLDQPTASLSGGEAARAQLAAVLLSRFDVLLLDEPTNDLDFAALDRLESFVVGAGGAARRRQPRPRLPRAHDHRRRRARRARPRTATRFEGGGSPTSTSGRRPAATPSEAYEEFVDDEGGARAAASGSSGSGPCRAWPSRSASRRTTTRRSGASSRTAPRSRRRRCASPRRPSPASTSSTSRGSRGSCGCRSAAAPRSGAVVARLAGAVVRRGTFTLGPVDLEIGWADRVAILGPQRRRQVDAARRAARPRRRSTRATRGSGPGVVVGEIDQARGVLDGDGAAARRLRRRGGLRRACRAASPRRARCWPSSASAPSTSPGRRRRCRRGSAPGRRSPLLQARGVNCLVLDEPTNHLDLPAIEQLEQAVEAFDGTVLLVTHDRRLLDAVTTTRTVRVDDGKVVET